MAENYESIAEVTTTDLMFEVNELLAAGWILLSVAQYTDGPPELQGAHYILGRPKRGSPRWDEEKDDKVA